MGILINALVAPKKLPRWSCRDYSDSVLLVLCKSGPEGVH